MPEKIVDEILGTTEKINDPDHRRNEGKTGEAKIRETVEKPQNHNLRRRAKNQKRANKRK